MDEWALVGVLDTLLKDELIKLIILQASYDSMRLWYVNQSKNAIKQTKTR